MSLIDFLYQKLTGMSSRPLYRSFAERVHIPLLAFDDKNFVVLNTCVHVNKT